MLEKILGHHIVAEIRDSDKEKLNDIDLLINTLVEACKKGGAGVIGHIEHKFTPHGVTVLVLLSESHCSVHSYPEYGYVACDAFTCGNHVNTHIIMDHIHNCLGGNIKLKDFDRGIPYRDDTYGLPEPIGE